MNLSLPFPLPRPSGLLLQGINALLRREPWAREQLAVHAGKSLRLSAGRAWVVQATVASDGSLQSCTTVIRPDVVLSIPPERLRELPAAWRDQGLAGVTGLAQVQGDAGMAHLVSDLARTLRWDVEDDLARLLGDILAVRLTQGVRTLAGGLRQTARRAQGNLAEYLGEESGFGVRGTDFRIWSGELRALEARLDRLDARLSGLERGRAC